MCGQISKIEKTLRTLNKRVDIVAYIFFFQCQLALNENAFNPSLRIAIFLLLRPELCKLLYCVYATSYESLIIMFVRADLTNQNNLLSSLKKKKNFVEFGSNVLIHFASSCLVLNSESHISHISQI